MDGKKIIILAGGHSPGEYLSSGAITIPEGCTGVLVNEKSVSWNDTMDDEKQRGIILSRNNDELTILTLSCDIDISDKIHLLQKAAQTFGCTLNNLLQAIERMQLFENIKFQIRDSLSKLESEYIDIAKQAYIDSNFDISERKLDQKQCFEFHNTIYGNKFRQAKHTSKHTHVALKQNTRRIRNNGMIKNRIHNYNKPATM